MGNTMKSIPSIGFLEELHQEQKLDSQELPLTESNSSKKSRITDSSTCFIPLNLLKSASSTPICSAKITELYIFKQNRKDVNQSGNDRASVQVKYAEKYHNLGNLMGANWKEICLKANENQSKIQYITAFDVTIKAEVKVNVDVETTVVHNTRDGEIRRRKIQSLDSTEICSEVTKEQANTNHCNTLIQSNDIKVMTNIRAETTVDEVERTSILQYSKTTENIGWKRKLSEDLNVTKEMLSLNDTTNGIYTQSYSNGDAKSVSQVACEKPYVCKVCGRAFNQLGALKRHERNHTGERPYVCKVCERAFSDPSNLIAHHRVHTGEKPYVCKVCDRAFNQPGALKRHETNHTGERPYVCKVCERAFRYPSNLKAHHMIHTGEKPFVCEVCEKAFSGSSNLKYHLITHTGEKPYNCSFCLKALSTSASLRQHEKIHTGVREFLCVHCGKSYGRKDYFKLHFTKCALRQDEKIYTGVRRFSCSHCVKSYGQNSDLKRHLTKCLKRAAFEDQILLENEF